MNIEMCVYFQINIFVFCGKIHRNGIARYNYSSDNEIEVVWCTGLQKNVFKKRGQ